jgi:cobalt-precorrin-5B (C1)-methyltransferase
MSRRRGTLRCGFSTGTAAVASARAALRWWLSGELPSVVGVRLAAGYFFPVPVAQGGLADGETWVSVIKDGGDDPDVTHKAEIRVHLRCLPWMPGSASCLQNAGAPESRERAVQAVLNPLICIIGGRGVGVVTKPGLPVQPGKPAVNPGPRDMLVDNLFEEMERFSFDGGLPKLCFHSNMPWRPPAAPHFLIESGGSPNGSTYGMNHYDVPFEGGGLGGVVLPPAH